MSGTPDPASAIDREIARLANDAARKVLAGELAADELDRIAQLRKVQDALPRPRDRTWLWAAAVALICVGLVTGAATVPWPVARIELEAVSASISFRPLDPVNWQGSWPVDPALIRFKNVQRPELPDFSPPPWSGRVSFDVEVKGGSASIRALAAAAGASVAIDRTDGAVTIIVGQAPSSVELNATGTVSVSGADASGARSGRLDAREFRDMPADFGASGLGTGAVPASLRVTPLGPLDLQGMTVQDLGFLREQVDAQQHSASLSELQSGVLTLTDTGEKVTLTDGAVLRFRGSSGALISLRIAPDSVGVRFEGSARGITLGRDDFARDLRPTVLEYLFHQQKVSFLWAAKRLFYGDCCGARARCWRANCDAALRVGAGVGSRQPASFPTSPLCDRLSCDGQSNA